ncbi:MAG: sensor histidine kinase [Candidatus Dormiibacterota bacterium]
MSSRTATRLSWGIGGVCLVLLTLSLVLLALDWKAIDSPGTAQLPYFIAAPIIGVLGVLIAARRPNHPIGWLLLAIAASNAISLTANFVAIRGILSDASLYGWVGWAAWVYNITGAIGALLIAFLILVFPDGWLLPGRRWRWAVWVVSTAAAVALLASSIAVTSQQLSPRLPSVPNPVAVDALNNVTSGNGPINVGVLLLLVTVLAAVVVRLRRSRGVERIQMRWFAYVAAASVLVIVAGFFLNNANATLGNNISNAGFGFGFYLLVPATIGLAIIRYGLYDLDVFISRTLVYGSLAVFITAVYVGIAVGVGALVGSGGKPNLALSILATAIVAIGFQPVRERVQKVANRLVYGKRATPYEVLSEFSGRVAETYAADEVLPRMAQVLQEGTGAESATVWLRGTEELRPAATFPNGVGTHVAVPMRNGTLPALEEATLAVEVRHQGELLGALSVTKRRGEALTPIEQKLVDDLAHQAGLVLKNVGLSADLQTRLDELRASRQRLVSAQDVERRRLERNLHDGAQQHLVALKVKLGLAELLLARDPEKAAVTLEQLKSDADEALEALRDLARGIYPPLLADKGLVVALESQARKATVPVRVESAGVARYAQDLEATVYFCVLEALQNVQKYAGASQVVVRLRAGTDPATLTFEVEDDGTGFETATARKGAGLTNMNDRVDALGGQVQVISRPGAGTTVSGDLPLQEPVAAVT